MRILIVSHLFYPEVGAAPTRLMNMAKGLKEKGADVDILTCMPNYPTGEIFDAYKGRFFLKEEYQGISIYRYWVYASNKMSLIPRLLGMTAFAFMMWFFALKRDLIKSYDKVIVQTPNLIPAFSACILFKSMYRKKVIVNVSDIHPSTLADLGMIVKDSRYYKILSWFQNKIYNKATAFLCQSNEILEQVKSVRRNADCFLYRNLQRTSILSDYKNSGKKSPLRIVYAGLVGATQDIYSIAKNIDFCSIGAELHIYGGGSDVDKLQKLIESGISKGVFYHGVLSKSEMDSILITYDASIVPLRTHIQGAVPSKIFDLIKSGIPILFSGAYSEASQIIEKYGLGFVSEAGDYIGLAGNVEKMVSLSDIEYIRYRENCIRASKEDFNYENQMNALYSYIVNL